MAFHKVCMIYLLELHNQLLLLAVPAYAQARAGTALPVRCALCLYGVSYRVLVGCVLYRETWIDNTANVHGVSYREEECVGCARD